MMVLPTEIRDFSRAQLRPINDLEAIPIIICARDEREDLPYTLASLAASDVKVAPIVIDNVSVDDTYDIAISMGATALRENSPGKHAAFKLGLEFLYAERGSTPILSTDADTLVNRSWAGYMSRLVSAERFRKTGALVFGVSIFIDGQSFLTDSLRTVLLNFKQARSRLEHRPPGARGHNMGLVTNESQRQAINALSGNIFPGQDKAIRDVMVENMAITFASLNFKSRVKTRGDRFNSLMEYFDLLQGNKSSSEYYSRSYKDSSLVAYK